MDEMDLGAALAEQAGTQEMIEAPQTQAPSAEPSAQEAVAQPEAQTEQPQQFDPTQMNNAMASQSEQIAQIAEQMSQMNARVPEQPQAPQSEEQMLQSKIKDDLGINQMEAQFKEQQGMIEQQREMMAQMQQQEAIRQRDAQFKTMETEFGNIDKEAIQNRLVEIGRTNPAMAEAMNSPEGVRMLLEQGVGTVNKTPDPITPSASGNNVSMDDSATRVLGGQGTNDDFGALLESYT